MGDHQSCEHPHAYEQPSAQKARVWNEIQAAMRIIAATVSRAVPNLERTWSKWAVCSSRRRSRRVYSVEGDTGAQNTGTAHRHGAVGTASSWIFAHGPYDRAVDSTNPESPPSTVNHVGALLREWRAARRMSQLDLALEVGMSARHLSCIER